MKQPDWRTKLYNTELGVRVDGSVKQNDGVYRIVIPRHLLFLITRRTTKIDNRPDEDHQQQHNPRNDQGGLMGFQKGRRR